MARTIQKQSRLDLIYPNKMFDCFYLNQVKGQRMSPKKRNGHDNQIKTNTIQAINEKTNDIDLNAGNQGQYQLHMHIFNSSFIITCCMESMMESCIDFKSITYKSHLNVAKYLCKSIGPQCCTTQSLCKYMIKS